MALTAEERHLVYEVFGIPNATSVQVVDGEFGTGHSRSHGAVLVTKTTIDARLDAVDLDDALATRLSELLVEWKKVSVDTVQIRPNVANEGVRINPRETRAQLRRAIRLIVPIFQAHHDTGGIPLG